MSEPAEKKPKSELVLGYWNIRGLAQPIRLLLKYAGADFEDVRYTQTSGPEFSRESWTSVKETLGLDFPNLPYLMDGDIKITQSNAVLAHLGRKYNLAGKNEAEMATVDMLANVAMDFRNGFVRLCYNKEFASMKEGYLTNVKATLKRYSDYLKDKEWFIGSEISYVDFPFYELLDQHRMMVPQILDDYDNLKAFLDRFEALPAIKEYLGSDEFKAWPVNNPIAAWGGNGKE